jgi:hypothetical protein
MNFPKINQELKENNNNVLSKTIITIVSALLFSISSFAQNGINYKALIKDDLGNVVANQNVRIQFSILDALSGGNIESLENHTIMSDANGIVIANIGEGSQSLSYGFFNDIDWGSHEHYLQVGIDLTGGTDFEDMGTSEFKTVPYALHAETIKNQAFKSEEGLTFSKNTTDDFVIGSTQLDDTGSSLDNARMFFDKDKASFRAGRALDDEWDANNVGNRSAAFGLNTIASGTYSMAIGNRTKAEALASTAIGAYNVGGGNPTTWIGTDPLFEIGNGTATINTETRNNALTVIKNGNVGIGFNSETPTQALDVSGKIKIANDFTTPTAGTIRFNETTNAFEGYIEETGWVTLGAEKREKTIVIPATQFVASLGTNRINAADNVKVAYTTNTVYLIGSSAAPDHYITAPIVLPIGSKLTSISYIFEDTQPEADLDFLLSKYCGDTGITIENQTVINLHAVSGIQNPNLSKYTYTLNETITSGCQYIVNASSSNGWRYRSLTSPNNLKVHKVYITYEED